MGVQDIIITGMYVGTARALLHEAGYVRAQHGDLVDQLDRATAAGRMCRHCGQRGLRFERWGTSLSRRVLLLCAACGKADEL